MNAATPTDYYTTPTEAVRVEPSPPDRWGLRRILKSMPSHSRGRCLFVWLLSAAASFAKMNVADVAGVVDDPSGGALARASIVAVNATFRCRRKLCFTTARSFSSRLDVYNSLNHPNSALPRRIFGAANFGVISSGGDAREMQAAVKLVFSSQDSLR
jgi:hypothetical protein